MILDAKNMELAGCYHQEKMSYDALFHWCEAQAAKFAPYICDVGAFLQQAHDLSLIHISSPPAEYGGPEVPAAADGFRP